MEVGLKVVGGKCIFNFINYEDGEEWFYKVLEIVKEYGVGIVIGIIDEDGMGCIVDKKFEIVKWVYEVAIVFGILVIEIFFDFLVLFIFIGIEEDRENGKVIVDVICRIC